jgi:hypothetical protein
LRQIPSNREQRPTQRTPERDKKFLDKLAAGYSVAAAAREAGYGRQHSYDHRKLDPDFAARWDEAVEAGTDLIEDEMHRRAVHGVEDPVYYQGEQCGVARKYSDTLMIFHLKGRRPEKYRDTVDLKHAGNVSLSIFTGVPEA